MAERAGFEPAIQGLAVYTLSRRAPSTARTPLQVIFPHRERNADLGKVPPTPTRQHFIARCDEPLRFAQLVGGFWMVAGSGGGWSRHCTRVPLLDLRPPVSRMPNGVSLAGGGGTFNAVGDCGRLRPS